MIPLLVGLVGGGVLVLGLWFGIRYQLRHNRPASDVDRAHRRARDKDRTPDPDTQLLTEARRMAARFVYEPGNVVEVTEQALRADPVAWHGKTIRVTGTWVRGLEVSALAGAWVRPCVDAPIPQGAHTVIAEGLWIFPRAPGGTRLPGFGHLGMSWGELHVYRVQPAPDGQ